MAGPRVYIPDTTAEVDSRKSRKRTVVHDTYQRLFGRSMQAHEFDQHIRAGFPVEIVDRLQVELGTAQAVVLKLAHISPATLTRRRASAARQRVARTTVSKPAAAEASRKTPAPARLSPEESDRIYRVASIIDSADQLFEGDHEAALRWLKEPSRALGGVTPLDCLETEAGTEMVRDLIGRLEYGVIT